MIGEFRDSEGRLRLVVAYPAWEDFLRLVFDEICYCGEHSVQVMRHMMALVNDLITRLPESRDPTLLHWEERLQATIARSFEDLEEKQEASVEDRQGLGVPRRQAAKAYNKLSLTSATIPKAHTFCPTTLACDSTTTGARAG